MNSSSVLSEWANFYVMAGSAAAALTGLMFVVITLVADTPIQPSSEGISAFSTPNVVHFCTALMISATLIAPWHELLYPSVMLGITGAYGIVYTVLILRKTRRLETYDPVIEDWIWYIILPLIAYLILVAAALRLTSDSGWLFPIGGAAILLLFVGIHNAWDVVTYLTMSRIQQQAEEKRRDSSTRS